MLGEAFGVARGLGLGVRGHDHVPGARCVAAEALAGVEVRLGLRDEPLLRRLPGDPHAPADVRPGRARTPGLVDEVPDQMVGDVAEVVRGDHRVLELVERVGVDLLDGLDEVVETYGWRAEWVRRHVSTVS